ncbi:MAG: metalloregulator ArsR/SmtB family transcription factor [Bryobacteraceae bacterium]|jgi:DNA-binding transcriptional ArsR family regulator
MSPRRLPEKDSATLFAALGDEIRLRLVVRLARGEPLSITELVSGTGITRQAVTRHLHVLAGAGLAHGSRRGREQHWSLDRRQMEQARAFLDRLSRQWDDALARLKAAVEGGDTPH